MGRQGRRRCRRRHWTRQAPDSCPRMTYEGNIGPVVREGGPRERLEASREKAGFVGCEAIDTTWRDKRKRQIQLQVAVSHGRDHTAWQEGGGEIAPREGGDRMRGMAAITACWLPGCFSSQLAAGNSWDVRGPQGKETARKRSGPSTQRSGRWAGSWDQGILYFSRRLLQCSSSVPEGPYCPACRPVLKRP